VTTQFRAPHLHIKIDDSAEHPKAHSTSRQRSEHKGGCIKIRRGRHSHRHGRLSSPPSLHKKRFNTPSTDTTRNEKFAETADREGRTHTGRKLRAQQPAGRDSIATSSGTTCEADEANKRERGARGDTEEFRHGNGEPATHVKEEQANAIARKDAAQCPVGIENTPWTPN